MRRFSKYLLCVLLLFVSFLTPGNAFSFTETYAVHIQDNVTIISYSPSWDGKMLQDLYKELLSNFYSDELKYLSKIEIYHKSPYGINGNYYDNINYYNGQYILGKNARIELFNGSKYDSVEKISRILSHEYGHHYSVYNIAKSEQKYYDEWHNSKYAKIRNLSAYPEVSYFNSIESFDFGYTQHKWDVAEIIAEDYVQLLGSPNAKRWVNYSDSQTYPPENTFNVKPQENVELLLAADITGLYEYFLELGGYKSSPRTLIQYPEIESIVKINENEAEVTWSNAIGDEPFQYTLVIYPLATPYAPVPIKTTANNEKNVAVIRNISNFSNERYSLKVYVKDSNNLIFASDQLVFKFSDIPTNKTNLLQKLKDFILN